MDFNTKQGLLIPELDALILCSKRFPGDRDISRTIELFECHFNWDLFISLMAEHRLSGPVYMTLSARLKDEVPNHCLNRIKQLHEQNTKNGLRNIREGIIISRSFQEKHIKHIFLKGFCLSQKLYGNPTFRYSGDIDLIIPEDHIIEACQVLESLGYRQSQSQEDLTPEKMTLFTHFFHHLGFTSNTNNTKVELHWKFHTYLNQFSLDFDSAHNQRSDMCIGSLALPVLNEYHTLIYLFLHGAGHFWERLFRLKDLIDLLNNSHIETLFIRDMIKRGLSRPLAEMYGLLNTFYEYHIPTPVQAYIRKDKMISRFVAMKRRFYMIPNSPGVNLLTYIHDFLLIKNIRYRVNYIRSILLIKYHKNKFNPQTESIFLGLVKKKYMAKS
ncbi:MAG: nucleotidyltransferase family protein [Proteobacteria bacterium]|nr:nucleotidyltransferase family protein [Pseudomonadota bacterium]